MPAPQKDTVRKEDRKCDTHGLVRHGFQLSGPNGARRWLCSKCDSERNREYLERKNNGGPVREYRIAKPEKEIKVCKTCNTALPLTGVCDYC